MTKTFILFAVTACLMSQSGYASDEIIWIKSERTAESIGIYQHVYKSLCTETEDSAKVKARAIENVEAKVELLISQQECQYVRNKKLTIERRRYIGCKISSRTEFTWRAKIEYECGQKPNQAGVCSAPQNN